MSDRKFNYGKAEADLYDSGCPESEEIYGYRTEKGIKEFMRENGLDPERYFEKDKSSDSKNGDSSDSGGCFLTTACIEARGLPDNCHELELLRMFRDKYLMNLPEGKKDIKHYYEIAPEIVKNINALPEAKEIWAFVYKELVLQAVKLIHIGEPEKAYLHYKEFTLSLEKKYVK